MTGRAVQISVVGAGSADESLRRSAERVGELIASRGGTLVCGGLGGVMEAACKGAGQLGGTAVALLPGSDRKAANSYANVVIPTGLGHARNVLVVQSGDAVVALPGETGTLSEIAIALKIGKPVVGVNYWGGIPGVRVAQTPEEAVELAFALAGAK